MRYLDSRVIWAGGVAAMAIAAAAPARAQAQQRSFDIPAEPATKSIPEFARQAGIQILAPGSKLRDRQTRAVRGSYEIRDALQRLLQGSGLRIVFDDGRKIGLSTASGEAQVARPLGGSEGVEAQNVSSQGESVQSDSEIVVTGTNIRNADPLSPVVSVTRDQVMKAGYGDIAQYLHTLPQTFGSVTPGFSGLTVTSNTGNLNSAGSSGVDLRGLGPEATLTILNGQRLPKSQGVAGDISSIPLSIIDRVEILTDGGSAIYGSDAIAGVVNIITRHDFSGLETSGRIDVEARSGNVGYQFGQLAGFHLGPNNVMLSAVRSRTISLDASERSFSSAARPIQSLLPDVKSTNLYGSIKLVPSARLTILSDNFYTWRDVEETTGTLNRTRFTKSRRFSSVNSIKYDITSAWRATIDGSYAVETAAYRTYRYDTQTNALGSTKDTVLAITPRVDGPVFDLPAGPVRLALGAAYQRETSFQSAAPQHRARDIRSSFGELYFPIVSPEMGLGPLAKVTVSASGRYDDYSDFGSTFNPKGAIAIEFQGGLRFQGSYSESFRAPSFLYTLTENNLFAVLTRVPDPKSSSGTSLAIYRFAGNPDLRPETAKTLTASIRVSPESLNRTHLEVGYFHTRYRNQISVLINQFGTNFLNFEQQILPYIVRNPTATRITNFISDPGRQFFNFALPATPNQAVVLADLGWQNAASTTISGLDYSGRTVLDLGMGDLALSLTGSHFFNYRQATTPNAAAVSLLNRKFFPTRDRVVVSSSFSSGGFTASGQYNFTSSYRDTIDTNCVAQGCPVRSYQTFDASVGYRFLRGSLKGFEIRVSALNLFDRSPPFINDLAAAQSKIGYDPSHASPLGRVLSLSLRQTW